MPANRKFIIRADVDPAVEAALDRITEQRGMTQVSLVSRAVKWLAHQDAETQIEILNPPPDASPKSQSKKLLKRLASRA